MLDNTGPSKKHTLDSESLLKSEYRICCMKRHNVCNVCLYVVSQYSSKMGSTPVKLLSFISDLKLWWIRFLNIISLFTVFRRHILIMFFQPPLPACATIKRDLSFTKHTVIKAYEQITIKVSVYIQAPKGMNLFIVMAFSVARHARTNFTWINKHCSLCSYRGFGLLKLLC